MHATQLFIDRSGVPHAHVECAPCLGRGLHAAFYSCNRHTLFNLFQVTLHFLSFGIDWELTEQEVAGVTYSDSAPVPKFLNPGPEIFQISKSDSCSDSSCHRSNRNLPMFLLEMTTQTPAILPKLKSDFGSGSGFSQNFDSGC